MKALIKQFVYILQIDRIPVFDYGELWGLDRSNIDYAENMPWDDQWDKRMNDA